MERRFDHVALFVLLGLGLAYQLVLFREGIGLIDEGHLANAARRVAAGEILYRDVYSVYPPASFHVVAWLFDLLGTSLLVVRGFHIAMTLALAGLVFVASRQLMERPFALLAGALVAATGWQVILEGCHYAYLYGAVPMAALLMLANAGSKGSLERGSLLAIGALSGLALAFRLEPFVGLCLAGTAVVLLRTGLGRVFAARMGWIATGTLLVLVPIGGYYFSAGALGALVRAVFWTSFGQYLQGGEFNLPIPALEWTPDEWSQGGLQRWFVSWEFRLPLLLYGGTVVEVACAEWRRRRSDPAAPIPSVVASEMLDRLALALFGAVLFLRATGRSDYYHLAPVLFPAYILGADWLARVWRRLRSMREHGHGELFAYSFVGLVLMVSLSLHGFDHAVRRSLAREGKVEIMPGGPLIERSQVLDDLVDDLRARTRPGEPIVVLPWYPILYFLADRPNPTRFDWLFPGYLATETAVAGFIEEIDRSPARVVVYWPLSIDGLPDRSLAAFAPEIDRFLRRRFEPAKRYGQFWILTRKKASKSGSEGGS